jgi:mannose-6-phosphate isomerase
MTKGIFALNQFFPQPYKLYNTIQNYEWGTKNEAAFIPRFLGIQPKLDTPYAELWIGAHPKAPSEIEIDGVKISLNIVVAKYPLECLGAYVCITFSHTFPFLLKILSAANALSIQTHPNKAQAQQLHAKDPKNYPDDNHKPEVAIALDSLTALAGFKPVQSIKKNLEQLPELSELIGQELIDALLNSKDLSEQKDLIKKIFEAVMQHAEDTEHLTACISYIRKRLTNKTSRLPEEEQFLEQHRLFGDDVGLFSFFFFNLVDLKPGEAIFTDAGIPHAYIKGTICECMANSDNVVRAGLTNKFKDVGTLLDVLRYDFMECPMMQAGTGAGETVYRTTAKEFEVSRLIELKGFRRTCISNDRPSVYLIMLGSLDVQWNVAGKSQIVHYIKGESFFIPASLPQYEISVKSSEAEIFIVTIPS